MLNPTLLIEVQSPTTESDDHGAKLDCYKMIASLRAVVLVAQDEVQVILHERKADGSWNERRCQDGALELPAIGCRLPLAQVHEDLPEG